MVEIKRVPYDYLEEDYNRYVEKKANIEAEFEAKREQAVAEVNAKIDAEKSFAVDKFDRLIAECSYDKEFEVEEPVVEQTEQENIVKNNEFVGE